jgi:hypothetical protein
MGCIWNTTNTSGTNAKTGETSDMVKLSALKLYQDETIISVKACVNADGVLSGITLYVGSPNDPANEQ